MEVKNSLYWQLFMQEVLMPRINQNYILELVCLRHAEQIAISWSGVQEVTILISVLPEIENLEILLTALLAKYQDQQQ